MPSNYVIIDNLIIFNEEMIPATCLHFALSQSRRDDESRIIIFTRQHVNSRVSSLLTCTNHTRKDIPKYHRFSRITETNGHVHVPGGTQQSQSQY